MKLQKQVLVISDSVDYMEAIANKLTLVNRRSEFGDDVEVCVLMSDSIRFATDIPPSVKCYDSIASYLQEDQLPDLPKRRHWYNPLTWFGAAYA